MGVACSGGRKKRTDGGQWGRGRRDVDVINVVVVGQRGNGMCLDSENRVGRYFPSSILPVLSLGLVLGLGI